MSKQLVNLLLIIQLFFLTFRQDTATNKINQFIAKNQKGVVLFYRTKTNGIVQLMRYFEDKPIKFLALKISS